MKSHVSRLAAMLLVCSAGLCSSALGKNPDKAAGGLPSFEVMVATALKHHPDVREAQAKLDHARLQVAREIRDFRDRWQSELAAMEAVEVADRETERLSELGGAVAGARLLEARRVAEAARQRASIAEAKLKEMKAMLPLLLGAAVHAEPREEHGGEHGGLEDVKKILRERLQTLTEVAKLQRAGYESGEVGFDAVASSQLELLAARLELAGTHGERTAIRRETLQVARQIEKSTAALVQTQEATTVDLLKARALRLRAEADLALERANHGH